MKRVIDWLLSVVLGSALAVLIFVVIVEWFARCGETYTDAQGNVHLEECVFIGGGAAKK
jgi:hypothetical protein